jgi:hypothetical protein
MLLPVRPALSQIDLASYSCFRFELSTPLSLKTGLFTDHLFARKEPVKHDKALNNGDMGLQDKDSTKPRGDRYQRSATDAQTAAPT